MNNDWVRKVILLTVLILSHPLRFFKCPLRGPHKPYKIPNQEFFRVVLRAHIFHVSKEVFFSGLPPINPLFSQEIFPFFLQRLTLLFSDSMRKIKINSFFK